jgi:hypothetical protein
VEEKLRGETGELEIWWRLVGDGSGKALDLEEGVK